MDTAEVDDIDQNTADLRAEETVPARIGVTLQSNIDSEATARANADTTLQNNIDAEETARIVLEMQTYSRRSLQKLLVQRVSKVGLRTDIDANTQGVADNASAISVETARGSSSRSS